MNSVSLGYDAKAILDSAAFTAAIARAEERIVSEWIACQLPDERERLWYRHDALQRIIRELRTILGDGMYDERRDLNADA